MSMTRACNNHRSYTNPHTTRKRHKIVLVVPLYFHCSLLSCSWQLCNAIYFILLFPSIYVALVLAICSRGLVNFQSWCYFCFVFSCCWQMFDEPKCFDYFTGFIFDNWQSYLHLAKVLYLSVLFSSRL